MEEPLINELLLVGAALGSTETLLAEDGSLVERFIRGENCLEWLQDLQRAVRHDDDATREVAIKLGRLRVVETKLIPLMVECRDDLEFVVTLTKLFVMLTMPLSPMVKKWARLEIDPREAEVRSDAIRRRNAARAQVTHLLAMKRAFVNAEVISVLVASMEEPLSRGGGRSEEDKLIVELVLTLFRNVLCIEDICKGVGSATDANEELMDEMLHSEVLVLLDREYIFDILLFLCQGIQARENEPWNLLLMEILFHIARDQNPFEVAAAGVRPDHESSAEGDPPMEGPTLRQQQTHHSSSTAALSKLLNQEKISRAAIVQRSMCRHSRFGTNLRVAGFDGKASRLLTNPFKDSLASLPQAPRKRSRRGALYSGGSSDAQSLGGGVEHARDPLTVRAQQGLNSMSRALIENAYEPFIKSLKNEFRRDSSRLEPGDRIVFFRITGFLLAFYRHLADRAVEAKQAPPDWVGSLVHSMDVLSFNLVLSTIDSLIAEKGFDKLFYAVALYKEMISMLSALAESSNPTHRHIAVGLQHKLFYASEPVDKLHKIMSCWKPGLFPRRFLCDVIELCEAQLKLLEENARKSQELQDGEASEEENPAVRDMLSQIVGFDLDRYFANLCTNLMVRMASHLLENYFYNKLSTNSDILSFFERMRTFDLQKRRSSRRRPKDAALEQEDGDPKEKQTLKPMLFNVQTLTVLNQILTDKRIAHNSQYAPLIDFAKSVVRHFGTLAQVNPLLLVEALFQHPFPHVYCENVQQTYCTSGTISSVAAAARAKGGGGREAGDIEGGATDHEKGYENSDDEEDDGGDDSSVNEQEQVEAERLDPEEAAKRKQSRRLRRKEKRRQKQKEDEEERLRKAAFDSDEDEWDGMLPAATTSKDGGSSSSSDSGSDEGAGGKRRKGKGKGGKKKKGDKRKAQQAKGKKPVRSVRWDFAEDSALRKNYPLYKGTESALFVLARLGPLEKKGRTVEQIKRRLRFLGLVGKDGQAAGGGAEKGIKANASDSDSSSSSSSSSSLSSSRQRRRALAAVGGQKADVDATAGGEGDGGQPAGQRDSSSPTPATATLPSEAQQGAAKGAGGKKRIRRKQVDSSSSSSDDAELDILDL